MTADRVWQARQAARAKRAHVEEVVELYEGRKHKCPHCLGITRPVNRKQTLTDAVKNHEASCPGLLRVTHRKRE